MMFKGSVSTRVEPGFPNRLGAHFDGEDAHFFTPGREGHWHFDLPGYVAAQLRAAGVNQVEALGRDTYREESDFFSFRRASHRGEPTGGRQISLIALA